MKEKKNIDRLFQEKFKDFEKIPDSALWNRIESTLKEDRKDRKVIPVWWKLAGVAAALIGFLVIGNLILSESSDPNRNLPLVEIDSGKEKSNDYNRQEIVDREIQENSNENLNSEPNLNPKPSTNNIVGGKQSENDTGTIVNLKNDKERSEPIVENPRSRLAKNSENNAPDPRIRSIDNTEKSKSVRETLKVSSKDEEKTSDRASKIEALTTRLPSDVNNDTELTKEALAKTSEENKKEKEIKDAIASIEIEDNEEIEKEEDEKLNRWNVAPNVSPVYFNSMGNGSSIDSQFNENSKTGDITFSYGINGSYAFNKKIKIRVGVNKVNLGYSTNDVIVFSGVNARSRQEQQLSNVQFVNGFSEQQYMSGAVISNAVAQPNVLITNPKGTLDQELGFVEVPVEIEYNILDKKIDLNLIGGFSTFFLDRNEVYTNFLGDRVLLGRATNINETSYSANIGLGVNYNFTKNLDLSIEPTFKYQINTFNNTSGEFQPYFIGVYSGIRFKF